MAQIPVASEPMGADLASEDFILSKVKQAYIHLEDCDLCPLYYHVNRRQEIKGAVCRTGERAVGHRFGPHRRAYKQ